MPKSNINYLTHWGRVTDICVGDLIIISSDNGLSPSRRQSLIWTKAGILSIGILGTHFSEILIGIYIQENAFQIVVWGVVAILSRSQCINEVVITHVMCQSNAIATSLLLYIRFCRLSCEILDCRNTFVLWLNVGSRLVPCQIVFCA